MQPPISSHQAQSARAAKNTRPISTQPIPENRQRRKPLALTARSPTNLFLQRSHIARLGASQKKPEERQCSRLYRLTKVKAPAPQKTRVPSRRSQFLKSVSDESRSPSPPAPPRTASSSALTSRAFGASQKKPEERQCSRLYRPIKLKAPAPQKARPVPTQPIPEKRQPRRLSQRSENLPMICRPARRPCAVFSHRSRPSPAAGCPPLDAGAYKKHPGGAYAVGML